MYIQLDFLLRRFKEQAEADPSLREKQPYKAAYTGDLKWLGDAVTKHYQGDDTDLKPLMAAILTSQHEITVDEHASRFDAFFAEAKHPTLGRPYTACGYAPMVELLRYLEANGFTNYIVSGGGRDFMRPITGPLYGIPPERVVGSSVGLDLSRRPPLHDGRRRSSSTTGPIKPVRLWSRIGRRPIFAAGNSNGDIEMLQFSHGGTHPSLQLLVLHDDADREFDYVAGAEKALDLAQDPRLDGRQHEERLDDRLCLTPRRNARRDATDSRHTRSRATGCGWCGSRRRPRSSAPTRTIRRKARRREVTVDGFWMQTHQVTNAAVRRIRRRHRLRHRRRAAAESRRLSRRAAGESAARVDGLPPHAGPVDLRHLNQWWTWTPGACWNHPRGPRSSLQGRENHPVVHVAFDDAAAYADWAGHRAADRSASGRSPPAAACDGATYTWGDEPERPGQRLANYWHGEFPYLPDTGYGQASAGRQLPRQRLRAVRHGGQRVGVDHRLVRTDDRADEPVLRRRQLRPESAAVPDPPQGHQGWLVPVRRQLLPALPARGPSPSDGRHRHEPHRLPLHQAMSLGFVAGKGSRGPKIPDRIDHVAMEHGVHRDAEACARRRHRRRARASARTSCASYFMLIVVAAVAAYLFNPLFDWLQKRFGKGLSVALTVLIGALRGDHSARPAGAAGGRADQRHGPQRVRLGVAHRPELRSAIVR